jgi:hypothetical protein
LAGNENAAFFGMRSELGIGFYILVGYSVLAGLLHYIFNSAVSEYYEMDRFHKIDYWWTPILRCFLTPVTSSSTSSTTSHEQKNDEC